MSGSGFSQELRQRQTQSLVLAPQLRQSLKILQVAALDLRSVIQEELQSNPTLEELPMEGVSLDKSTADNSRDGDGNSESDRDSPEPTANVEREGEPDRKREELDFSKEFDDATRRHMRFLDYAPILHISALTGERTPKILETIDRIAEARRKRVPTPALNKFVEEVTAANPPVSPGRRHVRILYAAQIGVAPPSFVFFTNVVTTFHFSYERFLVNKLREHFGFVGSPIRIQVRSRRKRARPSTR